MVTATQSAHKRVLGACWGNPADHGLTGPGKTGSRSKHRFGGQACGSTCAGSVGANVGVKNELSF